MLARGASGPAGSPSLGWWSEHSQGEWRHPAPPHPCPKLIAGCRYWNADKRLQGQLDAPLSKVGRRQAAVTGAWLAKFRVSGHHDGPTPSNTPFAAVYASDLERARFTAEAIAQHLHLPVFEDARLRETNLGGCPKQPCCGATPCHSCPNSQSNTAWHSRSARTCCPLRPCLCCLCCLCCMSCLCCVCVCRAVFGCASPRDDVGLVFTVNCCARCV
jgi:hypothetical protein